MQQKLSMYVTLKTPTCGLHYITKCGFDLLSAYPAYARQTVDENFLWHGVCCHSFSSLHHDQV